MWPPVSDNWTAVSMLARLGTSSAEPSGRTRLVTGVDRKNARLPVIEPLGAPPEQENTTSPVRSAMPSEWTRGVLADAIQLTVPCAEATAMANKRRKDALNIDVTSQMEPTNKDESRVAKFRSRCKITRF